MVRSPVIATRSGSRALDSSMAASRRSGLKRLEPTCMSEIWTMRIVSTFLTTLCPGALCSLAEREESGGTKLAGRVQEPASLSELSLDRLRGGRAGALLVGHAPLRRQQLARQLRERRVRRREVVLRYLFERASALLAPADELPDRPVRFAERDALRGQEVRELGREREPARGPQRPFPIEACGADHLGHHGEHALYGVHRIEERLLVLLQVLGVTEWQPLESYEHGAQVANETLFDAVDAVQS